MAGTETGYEARVAPGGAATGPAQAGPDAFGAGVGAAIGAVGETVDRLNQQRQATAAGLRAANAQLAITKGIADLNTTMGKDDPAYAGAVSDLIDSHRDDVLGGITHARVRNAQTAQWTEFADQAKGQAYEQSQVAQQARSITDLSQTAETYGARNALDPANHQAFSDGILALDNSIDAIHGPPSLKEKARAEVFEKATVPRFQSWILTDPKAAKAAIETGGYNEFLGDKVVPLLRSADVAIRTQDALARASATQQQAQAVKATDLDAATLRQGRGTFDQWTGIASKYETLDQPEKALEARGQADQIAASEAYRGASPVERQARIDALAAKPTRTAQEGNELKGLEGQQTLLQSKSALERAAYATGNAVAPIDWDNPATIQKRVSDYAAADQHFGGGGPPLTDAEIAPVKAMIGSGNRDEMVQAAHAILAFGPISSQVLDQAAGSNHAFRSAIALAALPRGGELMDIALKGGDALKAAPQMLVPAKDAQGHEGPRLEQIIAGDTAGPLALFPPAYRAALADNARDLYGGYYGQKGLPQLDPGAVRRSLFFALGGQETGRGRTGGLGQWQGTSVLLPRDVTQSEFDQKVSRATGAEWGGASVRGAPWVPSQNRTMSSGELRGLVPTAIGDGIYALRNADGSYVTTKDGGQYQFNVRKLPGTAHAKPALPHAGPDLSEPASYLAY